MSSRGKHLLEAFRAAGPGMSPPAASTPNALGKTIAPAPRANAPRTWTLNAPQARLIGLVALLAMVVAFLLGRMSVRSFAHAAGDADSTEAVRESVDDAGDRATAGERTASVGRPAGPAPSVQSPAAVVDPNPRTAAEQALLDRTNVYTIKLVHYSNTEVNTRLAAATARYVIEAHNLPAVVAADTTGLYILVGAAPRQVDLDDYLSRVKRMSGPPPQSRAGEFTSAYIEKIDKVFRRDK